MKRVFVYALIALAAGVLFVTLLQKDPGYVLIAFGRTTIEMTLWTAIAVAVVVFAAVYLALGLWRGGRRLPRRVSGWLGGRSLRRSQSRASQGIIAFIEERWERARRVLARVAERADSPLLYYLMAARASYALGNERDFDRYLRLAERNAAGATHAVELTRARLQVDSGQLEQALATLVRLRATSADHPLALRLQMQVYDGLDDYEQLRELLPALKRAGVLDADQWRILERRVHGKLLSADVGAGVAALEQRWRQLSRELRNDAGLARVYAEALVAAGDEVRAERFVRRFLRKQFDQRLVRLYGTVRGEDVHKQLLSAESWLRERNGNAELMLCLGRLALRNELWGKARDYFEASIGFDPLPEAYAELGRLLDRLGERERSVDCFRRGLSRTVSALPDLPLPAAGTLRRAG